MRAREKWYKEVCSLTLPFHPSHLLASLAQSCASKPVCLYWSRIQKSKADLKHKGCGASSGQRSFQPHILRWICPACELTLPVLMRSQQEPPPTGHLKSLPAGPGAARDSKQPALPGPQSHTCCHRICSPSHPITCFPSSICLLLSKQLSAQSWQASLGRDSRQRWQGKSH